MFSETPFVCIDGNYLGYSCDFPKQGEHLDAIKSH